MKTDIEILLQSYAKYSDKNGKKAQNLLVRIKAHESFNKLMVWAVPGDLQKSLKNLGEQLIKCKEKNEKLAEVLNTVDLPEASPVVVMDSLPEILVPEPFVINNTYLDYEPLPPVPSARKKQKKQYGKPSKYP